MNNDRLIASWEEARESLRADGGNNLFFAEEWEIVERRRMELAHYLREGLSDRQREAWNENLLELLELYMDAGYRTGLRAEMAGRDQG